ncbi:MAG: PD-(D/E)XK nuclease family protein [Gemmatimonadota bacterium]|nr:PD-(D/E)XK nuclease family protein [Gemmatimonadota bacterium]
MRTIVDILQRGNLELFHSSMLAWLLDSKGEHRMGTRVSAKLADIFSRKGWPQLEEVLINGGGEVRTEVKRGNHRYDILLERLGTKVVFENKTKTVGNKPQLESLQEDGVIVVALGLCDESFVDTIAEQFPLITYKDVLAAIKAVADDGMEMGAFGTLVEQYIQYLERELEIIELVRNLILCPKKIDRQFLAKKIGSPLYGENHRRFWNLIILEQCRRILSKQVMWVNTEWSMNKNMRSGVWLAGLPCDFVFSGPLSQCAEDFGASLWFHAELYGDALIELDTNRVVGMLQLRSEVEDRRNKEFAEQFHQQYRAEDNYFLATRIKSSASTFYVVGKYLQGRDLSGKGITKALTEFAQTFQ